MRMATTSRAPKISALMALDALEEAGNDVQSARYALKDALNVRDRLIQEAVEAGIRQNTIARRTGLSDKTIKRILMKKLDHDHSLAAYDAGAHNA